jgi:hypothetical protein
MRDLDALLNSLINIDRNSLVAILTSEADAARRSVNSARQRTASQRAKRHEAVQRAARIERICRSSSMATSHRTCLGTKSNSANLLNKSCVRGANQATRPLLEGRDVEFIDEKGSGLLGSAGHGAFVERRDRQPRPASKPDRAKAMSRSP